MVSAAKLRRSFFPAHTENTRAVTRLGSRESSRRRTLAARLTWEANALHLLSVVAAQPDVELLEFRVAPGDDGRSFVAASRLDHMDGVKLRAGRKRNRISSSVAIANATGRKESVYSDFPSAETKSYTA